MTRSGQILLDLVSSGCTDGCNDDERTVRRVFCGASLFVGGAGFVWGAVYFAFDEIPSGLIPTVYSVITLASFVVLRRTRTWPWFRTSQLIMIFILPFALMLSLGGFIPGSAVMIWAFLAPVGALWDGRSRQAAAWVVAFLAGTLVCGLLTPLLRDTNNLPDALITTFFVTNIGFVTGVLAALLSFYVRQMNDLLGVLRRNRELESAYMAQEVSLRQSEKLATLGKLSAGMAHELNNPAAAAQQATQQLGDLLVSEQLMSVERAGLGLGRDEEDALAALSERIRDRVRQPEFLDPLDRSDREHVLEKFLEDAGVAESWEVAPPLVSVGLDVDKLETLESRLPPERFADVLTVLSVRYKRENLIGGLNESTSRIIDLVSALKTYSYLDRASLQLIDIHEGLESTLVMLQHRLKTGIEVERSYAADLPEVEAYGSELNQVWTNIIDNAVDAMGGAGTIKIATSHSGDQVMVEIADNGPGIPIEIIDEVFDPFVTSKAPGDGTGLGLNIAYNIVTQKHGGEIAVSAVDQGATFRVTLPVVIPPLPDAGPESGEPGLLASEGVG
jgi:signal transduction histidine kinase